MNTGSLRLRVLLAGAAILLAGLVGFAVLVTVDYERGLQAGIRSRLTAGGRLLRDAPAPEVKQLQRSLALEGIAVSIAGVRTPPKKQPDQRRSPPAKPPSVASHGRLLSLTQPLGGDSPYAVATLTANQSTVGSAVNRLVLSEVLGGAVVLALGAALASLLLYRTLQPLANVARVAQQIASGDRTKRLRPRQPDTELGRMAAAFDAMVDALEQAVAEARASESAMRRFLADASHELRTPIAALQASAEALLREQPARPERDRIEAHLARSASKLGRLVDDLLNLARLEAREPLAARDLDLTEVAAAVIDEALSQPEHPDIRLAHSGPAPVRGDPDALGRAIRNLLDNAIAAAGADGHVTVSVRAGPGETSISVDDDGPGVPAGARARIFEGFVRLPGASGGGVGLGLAIARRIAQQHGGEISCDEIPRGARFTLRLRRAGGGGPVCRLIRTRSATESIASARC